MIWNIILTMLIEILNGLRKCEKKQMSGSEILNKQTKFTEGIRRKKESDENDMGAYINKAELLKQLSVIQDRPVSTAMKIIK